MLKTFQVAVGTHYEMHPEAAGMPHHAESRRIKYVRGDRIQTEEDLDKKFPNKFIRVHDTLEPKEVSPDRKSAVAELIDSNVWTQEDRILLEQMSDKDFARLYDRAFPDRKEEVEKEAANRKKKKSSPFGDDVTDSFPAIKEVGFKVFCNSVGKHQVFSKNSSKKPINPSPLEGNEVESFVQNFVMENQS